MLVFHDYECEDGHRQLDIQNDSNNIKRKIKCDQCEKDANMLFIKSNFIHNSHSNMYGKFHAGFGQVVESYSHKQELLCRSVSPFANTPTLFHHVNNFLSGSFVRSFFIWFMRFIHMHHRIT